MKISRLTVAALLVLVPSLAANIKFSREYQVGDEVVRIIDGDTFKLKNDQTIRLASIDAPDLKYCYGPEAKEALGKLILNKRVILLEPYADDFGRIIANVIQNGQIISEVMVRNGFAVDTYDNFSAKRALQEANAYARENKLGIYSPICWQTTPPNDKCVIKGNHDQRQGNKMYSYPGCTNYNRTVVGLFEGDEWFCSVAEAVKAGYTKSGDCRTEY